MKIKDLYARRRLAALALLLSGCLGAAYAATLYTQKGPHAETRPTLVASQFEQRNSGGNGWTAASFGTGSGTIAQGNDTRFNPAPSAAGRIAYDSGSGWAALTAGAANTLLQSNGAAAPSWTSAPTVSGANLTAGTVGYNSLATSATDRMLLNPALANNLVPVGNGTNWTAVGSITSGALLTAGATVPTWSTSLSGIIINAASNTVSNIATSMLVSGFNLAATQGGTGQTSYTVGDVLYASTTTALSKLAAGTSGYALTSNGAGVAPSYQAPITATHTCVTMSSASVNLTTTYANLGITLTSLAAGTYLIVADVRTQINTSVGTGNAMVRLYNTTAGAEIANSERITNYSNGMIQGVTTPIHEVVTLGSTSTIDVQGATSAGTFSSATANTDGTGRSRACAIKVSP